MLAINAVTCCRRLLPFGYMATTTTVSLTLSLYPPTPPPPSRLPAHLEHLVVAGTTTAGLRELQRDLNKLDTLSGMCKQIYCKSVHKGFACIVTIFTRTR